MSTTIHPSTVQSSYTIPAKGNSVFTRFIHWADAQQENRLLWLALALGGFGCALTPLTILLIVALTGMNLFLFMTALAAMAMSLIVNLAAMSTKITIPVLLVSVVVDLVVIAAAVSMSL
ncbi:hypothetical protein D3H65_30585 [Paraflavitalea soli]|uniref:Uncharacterized protein n=1 Tax=Paraflavitalea soli TaxID=2315862 RepID=A0A3B7N1Y8_9BACT|nr:hypothetical protein [Paraflavitalea soli]AXY78075.1 hypothetical protein D3H65_30585 [Paraflavitalea soli]